MGIKSRLKKWEVEGEEIMPYVVELYFDLATETVVHQTWQAMAEVGLKSPMLEAGCRPHISLGVYDNEQ